MSAPKTDIEKQKRRHFTPLVGVAIAVMFGAIMFLIYVFDVFESADAPAGAETEMQEASPPASEDAGAVDTPATDPSGATDTNQTGSDAETTGTGD